MEIKPHPVDVRLVNDVGRLDLEHHALARHKERARRRNRGIGVGRKPRGRHRQRIGIEQLGDFDRIEPGAALAQRLVDHALCRCDVGREILRQARRRCHQGIDRLAIAHEMHETADRLRLGRIVGDAGGVEGGTGFGIATDPDREHGFRWHQRVAMLSRDRHDRLRRFGSRRERGRHVHDQDGVVVLVVEQCFQRVGVADRIGVACDVDRIRARPDRRQCGVECPRRRG